MKTVENPAPKSWNSFAIQQCHEYKHTTHENGPLPPRHDHFHGENMRVTSLSSGFWWRFPVTVQTHLNIIAELAIHSILSLVLLVI